MTVAANNSGTSLALTAACPTGKQAIGGGASLSGSGSSVVALKSNDVLYINNFAGGWTAEAQQMGTTANSWRLTVHAICAVVS